MHPSFLLVVMSPFAPHGYCYLWNWRLILLHVCSDALIAISYLSIPVTLLYFVRQRRDVPFHWIFWLFGSFIIACGATHVMEIWTLWYADYWTSGVIKALTAVVSVCTAVLLVRIVPAALALPRPEELRSANETLGKQSAAIQEQSRRIDAARIESEFFINSVPSILIGTDQAGRISRWNHGAVNAFGVSEASVSGKTLADCGVRWIESDMQSAVDSWFSQTLPHKPPQLRFEKDGTTRYLGVTVNHLQLADDKVGGLLITGTDITERLHLESQLRQAQKLEAIGQLAAGIAHEINTPTQYVGDNVTFVKESWTVIEELLRLEKSIWMDSKGGPVRANTIAALDDSMGRADLEFLLARIPKALASTLDGVQRIAKIVKAMKEFSHPGGEDDTAIDINHAIETTLTVARSEWKYIAEVETDFDASLPLVPCFAGEVNQVILNLLTNAAHAIDDKKQNKNDGMGKIRVQTKREDDCAVIQIEDSGCGIPDHHKTRVFEMFFTTKEAGKGTGQGLALAHSIIVKKHGGQIWFESEVGKGTTFFLRLPLNPSERKMENAESNPVRG